MKRIIYSTNSWDFEEAKKDYKDFLEDNEYENINELLKDDNNIYDYINEINRHNWDDIQGELNKEIDNEIIAIASLGLWNGKTTGYKLLETGNLKEILFSFTNCDDIEFYTENRKVYGVGYHHDGRNYAEFRKIKNGLSQNQYDKLLNSIYYDKDSSKYIKMYTTSIYKDIKNIIG